jgi:ABC-2 type transport system ATP-binding protein
MKNGAIIEVSGLTKKFKDFTAVDSISFDVKKGEIFGLLGPNGAGKSTTIRMLTTLTRPTGGEAKVCGYDIGSEAPKVRQHIGLVAEKIILYDRLTAIENLRLFGKLQHWTTEAIEKRADELLKLVSMDEWKDRLAGTYSTGMKQRVNIARALLNEPDVLFLDEPTLGLDPQTTRTIREFILDLKKRGITIVLTTHIMNEAEMLCDRVGIIDQGKIVALDTTDNLKKIISKEEGKVLELAVANLKNEMVEGIEKLEHVMSVSHLSATEIRIHAGHESIDEIVDVVRKHDGKILNIGAIEPTLEDVFLHLTGREMRDEASEKIKTPHSGPGSHFRAHSTSRTR